MLPHRRPWANCPQLHPPATEACDGPMLFTGDDRRDLLLLELHCGTGPTIG